MNARSASSEDQTDRLTITRSSSKGRMAVASPSSVWRRQTNPGCWSAKALMGPSWATNPASSGPSRGARRVAMLTWARWWAAMASANHALPSMSILVIFRRWPDGDAAAAGCRVHLGPAGRLADPLQQPLDQAQVHGADQHRVLAGEVGEGAVAQPQRGPVVVRLVPPGRQHRLDARLAGRRHLAAARLLPGPPGRRLELQVGAGLLDRLGQQVGGRLVGPGGKAGRDLAAGPPVQLGRDRKSTRLNSSHVAISYAVFCLKKKKKTKAVREKKKKKHKTQKDEN